MKRIGQKGFTLVEGLLLVLVLTVLGGTGFYVYNSTKDDKEATQSAQEFKLAKTEDKKSPSDNKEARTRQEAAQHTKEYYEFRYIEKWGDAFATREQMAKWLTPELIDKLGNERDGYQGRADCLNVCAPGFTKPDSIETKVISFRDQAAVVEVTFAYKDNPQGSPKLNANLVSNNNSWLISSVN